MRNDEGRLHSAPATNHTTGSDDTPAAREPTVEELIVRCRAVAAAAGFSWLHDLVLEELARLRQKAAA